MRRAYSDAELREAVETSTSIAGALVKLHVKACGGNYITIKTRINQAGLSTTHFLGQSSNFGVQHKGGLVARKWTEVLRVYSSTEMPPSTREQRRALAKTGAPYRCCACGLLPEWQGKSLVLEIHHLDGDKRNCQSENLGYFCPNCHSQTDTFRGRNVKAKGSGEVLRTKRDRKKLVCSVCGKPAAGQLCRECKSLRQRKVDWPSREALSDLFAKQWSVETIAREYKVSGSTVRKWATMYEILWRVRDRKSLSQNSPF